MNLRWQGLVLGFALTLCASAAGATPGWYTCSVMEVASYQNRIHVRCGGELEPGAPRDAFYAAATTNAPHAERLLKLLTAAFTSGKTVRILADPRSNAGNPPGCQPNDCRRLDSVAIR